MVMLACRIAGSQTCSRNAQYVRTRLHVDVPGSPGRGRWWPCCWTSVLYAGQALSARVRRCCVAALPWMILARAAALGGAASGRWGFAARENLYPRPRADAVENLVHSALVARNDLQHAPVEELVFGFPRVVVVAAAGVGDDLKIHPGRVAGAGRRAAVDGSPLASLSHDGVARFAAAVM